VVADQSAGELVQPLGLEHLGQSGCGGLYGRRHRYGFDLVRVRVRRVRVRARARPPAPLQA